MSEIIIYQDGENAEVEVKFDGETVWLTQYQIAFLFDTDRTSVLKHIQKVYKDGELAKKQTCANFAQVQKEGDKTVTRSILHYNLDVIISVGYKVNSKQGTRFRQWATQRLKDYLVKGYAINQDRLNQLGEMVNIIQKSIPAALQLSEAKGLVDIMGSYAKSFVVLSQYDNHNLEPGKLNHNITYEISYEEAKAVVAELKKELIAKKEATPLFGNERNDSFKGVLQSILQTFGGQYLYPTIEEQAAHLLYFIIKDHPFIDGNKRSGALLFIWFLEKNKHQLKKNGEPKVNDNALIALALLVAQSNPAEKDLMITLICNLINNQS